MSLRMRWLATVMVLAIPTIAAVIRIEGAISRAAEVESLHRFILGRMEDGRGHCESDPRHFPPPPRSPGRPPHRGGERRPSHPQHHPPQKSPPIELFAYGPDFVSANPRAPRFPDSLRARLVEGATIASERVGHGTERGLRVAARMPWDDGPCVFVIATRHGRPTPPPWTRGPWTTAGLVALLLAGATWLATGPLVTRVRRLTEDVRRSAVAGYNRDVRESGSDELTALAREFNSARAEIRRQMDELEEREQTLREFVANTTHDVMIPMTVLQGHLSRLELETENAVAVRGAIEECQYMTSLIENLGVSARLDSGPSGCEFSTLRFDATIQRVVDRHRPLARSRGITLEYAVPEFPVQIEGDETLLEQAAGNLVQNAIQYGIPGGHVAVLLEQRGSAPWRLRILDDGPGIEPEALERLLGRASRGDGARGRHPEGQGLGLAIVRDIVERHGLLLRFGHSEFGGLEVEIGPALDSPRP